MANGFVNELITIEEIRVLLSITVYNQKRYSEICKTATLPHFPLTTLSR